MQGNDSKKELTVKQLEALLKKQRRKERVLKQAKAKKTKKKATTKKVTQPTKSKNVSMTNIIGLLIPFTFIALIVIGSIK